MGVEPIVAHFFRGLPPILKIGKFTGTYPLPLHKITRPLSLVNLMPPTPTEQTDPAGNAAIEEQAAGRVEAATSGGQ